jgi:hypothetical protein
VLPATHDSKDIVIPALMMVTMLDSQIISHYDDDGDHDLGVVAWAGYSIGSASLACFLLFGAFMDEFSQFTGKPFRVVDIAVPEVLVGGLIGVSSRHDTRGPSYAFCGRGEHALYGQLCLADVVV